MNGSGIDHKHDFPRITKTGTDIYTFLVITIITSSCVLNEQDILKLLIPLQHIFLLYIKVLSKSPFFISELNCTSFFLCVDHRHPIYNFYGVDNLYNCARKGCLKLGNPVLLILCGYSIMTKKHIDV